MSFYNYFLIYSSYIWIDKNHLLKFIIMKKILFSFLLIAGIIQVSNAQGFQLGLLGGADIQKINGESFEKKFAYGYHGGVFANIIASKSISIQPEVYYSSATSKIDSSLNAVSANYNTNVKFEYLNIAGLLNFSPAEKLSIQIGPKYSILSDKNLSIKANANNAIKAGELSVVAGLQVYVASFRIYGRYQIGLSDINNLPNQQKWNSQVIHIGVGWRLF